MRVAALSKFANPSRKPWFATVESVQAWTSAVMVNSSSPVTGGACNDELYVLPVSTEGMLFQVVLASLHSEVTRKRLIS